ncbi:MAG: SAM-dependent chlorinase/fluorinase [Deltaproteobacteria bacterium]|nr:SAM-dependent chlorinase/fluorinase [Deltaproteobacteria bacterium]
MSGFTANGLLTLTSDFGTADGWVGAMKGVCLSIDRGLVLVDVAHDVPPQDVVRGAAALAVAAPEHPAGTTHLAVVDPGVGTERAAIVIVRGGHAFVGPDNGLFDDALARLDGPVDAWVIEAHAWLPARRSSTFHGRDVFAPTAAAIASGRLAPAAVGRPLPWLPAAAPPDGVVVRFADRFGNLVTSLREAPRALVLPDGTRVRVVGTYGEAGHGELVALLGSDGFVELAVRDGSALARTGLARGARLTVEP